MYSQFVATDIYRAMLGCGCDQQLRQTLGKYSLSSRGGARMLRRDDGATIHVVTVLVDGGVLAQLAEQGVVAVMQLDNVSARLRAEPELPGGDYAHGYLRPRYGYAA